MTQTEERALNFIEQAIEEHNRVGRFGGAVVTRFPPEPNGFLHIGHAKAICIDFGLAAKYGGRCHLRFDDTNPAKEEQAYIDAIREDVRWLGFDWGEHEYYASDYFEQLYLWAERLIEAGQAYVEDLSMEEIRAHRGTLTEPGRPSPYRDRSVEENLDLFRRMRAGEFPNGARVLRAKIDMASPNLNLRDPVMYRILHEAHPRTGDAWCLYPMYDWAHGQSDSIEGVTHSLCSLEFEAHRPLYEWFVERLGIHAPQQMEFARGNITYMITSKRKLRRLIDEGIVSGWDDPRMPTLRGMRRRGYTPEAIRRFWDEAGVAKRVNNIAFSKLESVLRDDLNKRSQRRMAVLDPIRVVITNYPEGQVEMMSVVNNPEDPGAGRREVPFSGALFIERDDFMEDPPKKFFRLGPGREVRLRSGYWIRCEDYVKDAEGKVTELRCTYDPQTRGGESPPADAEGKVRKVKGTLHWVSAAHAVDAEVRVYDHLFTRENPEEGELAENVNPDSLRVLTGCKLEPALSEAGVGEPVQFERLGYFTKDPDSSAGGLVFNRTATLKDSWAKAQKKG
ncbi:glutamine--tRNA ligase/YqeY domain fusion protein [Mucisphaera calidilacus]|uniref:Glutamine--tRNA ligase n=1 Tax=Mucisphaera calidilacus TaxID=2527982 RepID=A0A518BV74_9BACT|nr:glutamine--tRNA ligase/YqeY domain fusion protein [Mucisphaera calidilacus]QDU70878.1 Glutamine--tRNA ligase [Mucisphaera calidilacus]